MSKAPPTMDLYPGDLIKSCVGMAAETFGAYWRLLCYQWEHGHIPDHADERARVAGVELARWPEVWERMADRFMANANGKCYHERTADERNAAIERWERNRKIAEKRKKAGKSGAKQRWQKNSKCYSKPITNLEGGRWKVEGPKNRKNDTPPEPDLGGLARWWPAVELPAELEPVRDEIDRWADYLADQPQYVSEHTVRRQLAAGVKHGAERTAQAIGQAIERGWKSLIWDAWPAPGGATNGVASAANGVASSWPAASKSSIGDAARAALGIERPAEPVEGAA